MPNKKHRPPTLAVRRRTARYRVEIALMWISVAQALVDLASRPTRWILVGLAIHYGVLSVRQALPFAVDRELHGIERGVLEGRRERVFDATKILESARMLANPPDYPAADDDMTPASKIRRLDLDLPAHWATLPACDRGRLEEGAIGLRSPGATPLRDGLQCTQETPWPD